MARITHKEVAKKAQEIVDSTYITIYGVRPINHKPHPFVIGAKHIKKYVIELTIPCALCKKPYEEHTHEVAIFIQFKKDITESYLQEQLKLIIDTLGKEFDGFVFVEGDGKIIEDETK